MMPQACHWIAILHGQNGPMTQTDSLRSAFHDPAPLSRRQLRADRTLALALSPVRILVSLLMVPVVATSLTVSIYLRASPFEHEDTLRHLIAMTGCETAFKLGVAPARQGEVGYHAPLDSDGNGISCEMWGQPPGSEPVDGFRTVEAQDAPTERASGAKFVRP